MKENKRLDSRLPTLAQISLAVLPQKKLDMTIREFLVQKKRAFLLIHVLAIVIILASGIISTKIFAMSYPWPMLPLAVAYIALITWTFMKGIGCPKCGTNLLPILYFSEPKISLPKGFKFCPGCAVSLDSPVE